ncbi:MAG: hypothetical protein R3266_11320 [Gemmatimonadota bacterium]|nr:hypothetical protein [Gemmatimonadota bacterium]
MSPGRVVAVACVLALGAACQDPPRDASMATTVVTTDTVDPALQKPGTVFRFGPATEDVLTGPVEPPVVEGDSGQVSIYEGFFVQAPCARPLRAGADTSGDTIIVRVVSEPDTARTGPCLEEEKALGYAMLVGRFEPGDYAVRVIHEGDLARDPPLDRVYEDIGIQ